MQRAALLKAAPTLQQFGGIVLLAGGDLPLRLWIEQVATRLSASASATIRTATATARRQERATRS